MKVALIGGSPSGDGIEPRPDFEVWVHGNQLDRRQGRVDRIFEIHDDLSEHPSGYAKYLVDQGKPLVVGRKFPIRGEGIRTFPFSEANEMMGQHLTSTPAYMMALALLEGASEIEIIGVDMAVDDHEYFYQRPTMYAWIAFAKARGVKIYIHGGLFIDEYIEGDKGGKPDLGLPPFTSEEFGAIARMHQNKIKEIEGQILNLQNTIHAHSGALQTYQRLEKVARGVEAGASIKTLTETVVIP